MFTIHDPSMGKDRTNINIENATVIRLNNCQCVVHPPRVICKPIQIETKSEYSYRYAYSIYKFCIYMCFSPSL